MECERLLSLMGWNGGECDFDTEGLSYHEIYDFKDLMLSDSIIEYINPRQGDTTYGPYPIE